MASGIATLLITFTGADTRDTVSRGAALAAGLLVLWWAARSERVDRWLTALIRRILRGATDHGGATPG